MGFAALPALVTGSSALRARAEIRSLTAGGAPQASVAGPASASVSVTVGGTLRSVPVSYLGIAVENNDLLKYARSLASFTRLLGVLRPPGDRGPLVMRLGGESADSSFWQNDAQTLVAPRYQQGHPYSVTPAWMDQLSVLIRSVGLKVILDLNLAAHSPKMAAEVARAARLRLPTGSVMAFEIGNEPDLYRRGLVGLTRAQRGGRGDWAFRFTIPRYISLFGAYARAIDRAFRGAPIVGPATTSADPRWVTKLLASHQASKVSLVTTHEYPLLDGCATFNMPRYPSATKYLKDSLVGIAARLSRTVVAAAQAAGQLVRMTEVGSSYCHGVPGQSDTFATALWAPDQLFTLLAAGVSAVNVEVQTNHPNSSLNYTNSVIYPEPMFYGLALFARTLGPGAQLMRIQEHGGLRNLKVWAVRLRDGTLRVLYINKGQRRASVTLNAPSAVSGPGLIERLTAPSIHANTTVTLAGQRLGPDGLWHRTLAATQVPQRHLSYRVKVPGRSAALLSVPPAGGR